MNLAAVIDPHPADRPAIVSRGRTTTYGTLREQVAAYRGGLVRLGLRPGDRVGILAGTNWYFTSTYLAVLGAGCVAVPMNPTAPPRVVEQELAAVGARAVFVGPGGAAPFSGIDRSAVPELRHVIAPGDQGIDGAVDLDALLAGEPAPLVPRDRDDLAVLVFTSGTAGAPRAACLTHGNLLANLEQVQSLPARALHPDDVVLGVLPLFHIFGLNVVLGGALYAGASALLVERFEPATVLELVRDNHVTVVVGAPTMWAAWATLPGADPEALASVRLAVSGAAKLDREVAEAVRRRFGVEVTEGYGLTEASPVVTTGAGSGSKPGSVGVPLPGVELRVVDPAGDDVLPGDPGEIWVRGPNVFPGYWQDEAATAEVLTPDGWLRTGDVAVVDDDGAVYIVDRAKDLIIVSGFNVFPAEVEDVLVEHPSIEQAAVVGVPHPHTGEAVKAYVVVRAGASIEEDDVVAFCAERLPRYKCPEKVEVVDAIPVGLGGKLLRRTLRQG